MILAPGFAELSSLSPLCHPLFSLGSVLSSGRKGHIWLWRKLFSVCDWGGLQLGICQIVAQKEALQVVQLYCPVRGVTTSGICLEICKVCLLLLLQHMQRVTPLGNLVVCSKAAGGGGRINLQPWTKTLEHPY